MHRTQELLLRLSLWLACAALFAWSPEVAAGEVESESAADRAVLIHWNDFHGQVYPRVRSNGDQQGGVRALSHYLDEARASEDADRILVLDAGDWFQGTPEGNLPQGRMVLDLWNALGVDVASVGNHDYDYGETNLKQLVRRAEFPVLGANVIDAGGNVRSYLRPFCILEAGGIKFGVLGLLAPDTPRIVRRAVGRNLKVENPIKTCRKYLPRMRAAGAECFVVLSHLGITWERVLAKAVPELHLIIGGHSHTALEKPERTESGVVLVQAGSKASFVGQLEVTRTRDGGFDIQGGLHRLVGRTEPVSAKVEAVLARYSEQVASVMEEVVGKLEAPLQPPVRGGPLDSSSLGNWICEVFLRTTGAQVAIHNRGGIRDELNAGSVTRRQLFQISPFGNNVAVCSLRGDVLWEILDLAIRGEKRMVEIAGAKAYWTRTADGPRLSRVEIAGQALERDRIYRVATNDYLALGGDGWSHFDRIAAPVSTGIGVFEATVSEFQRVGTVVPNPNPENRFVEESRQ